MVGYSDFTLHESILIAWGQKDTQTNKHAYPLPGQKQFQETKKQSGHARLNKFLTRSLVAFNKEEVEKSTFNMMCKRVDISD